MKESDFLWMAFHDILCVEFYYNLHTSYNFADKNNRHYT